MLKTFPRFFRITAEHPGNGAVDAAPEEVGAAEEEAFIQFQHPVHHRLDLAEVEDRLRIIPVEINPSRPGEGGPEQGRQVGFAEQGQSFDKIFLPRRDAALERFGHAQALKAEIPRPQVDRAGTLRLGFLQECQAEAGIPLG